MRKLLDNYLVIQHRTTVIDHLFNDYDLTYQFQSIYTFIDKKKGLAYCTQSTQANH
ncbi:hypothetical protein [Gilliamella sp. B3804]|uniref:hypothetical protein n=1 Tax=Gilliamella sp. B3804 TaxID=2817998 RepID=UPI00226A2749|nr:hypothetical protein [Gilliamella sp. B3804]